MSRWWTYQKERFPLPAHGPLIAAFSACAVSYSALLSHAPVPSAGAYAVAFGVCLLMFLQLRIADEFKDREEDARWRPYRPVPRGLVKLSELRLVFIAAAGFQLMLSFALDPWLSLWLGVAWGYLALMSVEFFCRDWLKARPVVYLWTHMGIMPLVDFFATSCEWLPSRGHAPSGLGWFLGASFCNGIVIELGRKLRQPADEEEGVETYSRLWGMTRATTAWFSALVATTVCATMAARAISFLMPVVALLALGLVTAAWLIGRYRRGLSGKKLEAFAGMWTLALYLVLGAVPLILRSFQS